MINLKNKPPFYKNISEIEYKDIENLKENKVPEGIYIEYKSRMLKSKKNYKIAQSLASFANSYGGWYIVGIEEKK